MTATRWAIEDENEIEVDGRKFARGEEGAPMLCNMFCQGQTRVSASSIMAHGLYADG